MAKKNVVTVGQIFTLLFISRISLAVIYSVTVSGITSIWSLFVPLLLSILISILLLVPVNLLYGKNRKKSVCHIAVEHFGTIGHIIPILYALYFLCSCIYSVMALEHFLDVILPADIHAKAVLTVLVIACIYAALKGIEALSRMAAVVLGLILFSAILMLIYLIQGFAPENILPVEYLTFGTVTDGIVFIISRMNTSAAFNVLVPFSKGKLWKSTILWSVCVFLFMGFMLILFRGAIGDYLHARELSVYQAIEGAGSLQRLNPFFIFVSMCSIFCHISILLFAVSESAKTIFQNAFGKTICFISGVILLGVIIILPDNQATAKILFNSSVWCIATVIFTSVIPLTVYIALKLKESKTRQKTARKIVRTASMTMILSVIILIAGGCSSTQLNQRLIVQGIGIDKNTNGYDITLIVLDTENEEKENAIRLIYTNGKTTDEALSTLENQRGKKLLLSQCLFIMMNQQAAESYHRTLSYFAGLSEMQKTANLMVTEESSKKILSSAIDQLGYQSEYINVLADSKAIRQTEVHCSLIDYISSLNNGDTPLLFPYITIKEDISALSVNGSCLVDNHLFYRMTSDETLGTLIINQKVTDFTDTVHTQDGEISYQINKITSHIIPKWNQRYFDIQFDIQVYLDQNYDNEVLQDITENIRQKVNASIDKTLFKSGSDLFSLHKYIRSAYPELYQEISDMKTLLQNSVTHTEITCM